MLEANPALTPNAVKAILQYTAESKPGVQVLAQGAGFLNARGAVELARRFTATADGSADFPEFSAEVAKDSTTWSRHIIWGNRRVGGGVLAAAANAWSTSVTWGDRTAPGGRNIVWGTIANCDGAVDGSCEDAAWGTAAR
jgi:hypothetical protein